MRPFRHSRSLILLLPLMLAARLRRACCNTKYDPTAEFRIPRVANASFEKLLDVETALIRAGVSFPAGGSLLMVARRDAAA